MTKYITFDKNEIVGNGKEYTLNNGNIRFFLDNEPYTADVVFFLIKQGEGAILRDVRIANLSPLDQLP